MKRFLIQTSVLHAEGSQTWYVDADSEEEALQKYNDGVCDLYSSEVDVTSLGEPDLAGETTLDDFGDFAAAAPLPEQEPPSEWAGTKAILDEYGLQAIDFVADFKAALAQPAQEPAEWLTGCPTCGMDAGCDCDTGTWNPPQRPWVGLTDERITDIAKKHGLNLCAEAQRKAIHPFARDLLEAAPLPVQEPVGKVVEAVEGAFRCEFTVPLPAGTKLYTTPPKREWVGLTDGEAGECHSPNYVQTVARIEAKLKEKNA